MGGWYGTKMNNAYEISFMISEHGRTKLLAFEKRSELLRGFLDLVFALRTRVCLRKYIYKIQCLWSVCWLGFLCTFPHRLTYRHRTLARVNNNFDRKRFLTKFRSDGPTPVDSPVRTR